MTAPLEEIIFTGRDGHECEEFIQAIRKVAYASGKIRDDAWMADLASTCFSRKALRYYESLDPEVQSDWRLLRRALLTKYPAPDDNDDELLSEGSRMPQIAMLWPTIQPRTGRIKVIGANSLDFDYIGDGNTFYLASGLGAGASASDACTFCYIPGSKLFEIQIKRPGDTYQILGVHWHEPSTSTAVGSLDYAALTAFNYEGIHRSSKLDWAGSGSTRIWKVMPDSTLSPHLEDGTPLGRTPLQFFILQNPGNPRRAIVVAADPGAFITTYMSHGWKVVKLLFEPLD